MVVFRLEFGIGESFAVGKRKTSVGIRTSRLFTRVFFVTLLLVSMALLLLLLLWLLLWLQLKLFLLLLVFIWRSEACAFTKFFFQFLNAFTKTLGALRFGFCFGIQKKCTQFFNVFGDAIVNGMLHLWSFLGLHIVYRVLG